MILGHAHMGVTENYVGYREGQLRDTLADVLKDQLATPPNPGVRVS